jgi:hypothetical protein
MIKQNLSKDLNSVLKDDMVPWECYRSPTANLVYFIHNKCASTLYDQLFIKLNWAPTNTQKINWDQDIVFSHIKDPLVKHRKGIVEGVSTVFQGIGEALVNIPNGIKFLANIISVEPHSYTIYRLLGLNALKVHWIPLDIGIDHKHYTFEFIEENDKPILDFEKEWFYSIGVQNSSTPAELDLYNRLMAVETPSDILRHIDFDQQIYDCVTKYNFEPDNYQDRIKELTAQGIDNLEAQKIADSEVKSGEYLQWKKELNC